MKQVKFISRISNAFFIIGILLTLGFQVHAQEENNEVFTIVENMPAAMGCVNVQDEGMKRECTTEAINKYIVQNILYPEASKNAGVEGTVYIGFIVNNEGNVEDVEVIRGIKGHNEIDEEAVRVVKSLPQFTPGTQRGKKVNVRYNLPIRFSL